MKKAQLTLEDTIDRGTLHVRDANVKGVRAICCGLSIDTRRRSTFENCTFTNIHSTKCSVGYPIFRNCTFAGSKGVLFAYGALFLECRLQGVITGVSFALTPLTEHDSKVKFRILKENLELAASAKFCIDVREATLPNVGFKDEALVSRVLFKRGQCVIYRGSELKPKLTGAFHSTSDRRLQSVLFPPLSDKDTLLLTSLYNSAPPARVDEIRSIVDPLGIEVLEEPLCGVN